MLGAAMYVAERSGIGPIEAKAEVVRACTSEAMPRELAWRDGPRPQARRSRAAGRVWAISRSGGPLITLSQPTNSKSLADRGFLLSVR